MRQECTDAGRCFLRYLGQSDRAMRSGLHAFNAVLEIMNQTSRKMVSKAILARELEPSEHGEALGESREQKCMR